MSDANGREPRIGYIGVDILNNATICNETTALLEKQVPLELVSVYQFQQPTFYQNETLQLLDGRIHHLYPLKPIQVALDLLKAPMVFGRRFFSAVWKAATAKAEGPKQRLKCLAHLLPAIQLALHWRKRNVTHVHAQWAHTATTIGMHAAEMLGIGFSFMGHANDLFVHRVVLDEKIRRARFIACISEYHRRFYLERGADPARLQVVYCGISLDRFRPRSQTKSNTRRIVAIGRLVEKKGFHHLIEACVELVRRDVPFECVIAGSGPEEDRLREMVERFDLAEHVTITGRPVLQEEMPELLHSARLFALPCVRDRDGDMDGLPQVLIESMACRVPAVSTFLVGIPDLVRHRENGLLVETENVSACADALQELLENDELVEDYGVAGERWAREHFARKNLSERMTQLLQWCANHAGSQPPDWLCGAAPGSVSCYEQPRYETGCQAEQVGPSEPSDEPVACSL